MPLAWSHTAICWPRLDTAAQPPGLNFLSSLRRAGYHFPSKRRGPSPGVCTEPRNHREGSAHKKELFHSPVYRQQTEPTNERALVENLNWGWTVVNPLRAEFRQFADPAFMAHPHCPFFEVSSVCNNRGRPNLAAGWGVGVAGRPSSVVPFPFSHPNTDNFAEIEGRGAGGRKKRKVG